MTFRHPALFFLVAAACAGAAAAQDAPAAPDSAAFAPAVRLDVRRLDVDSLAVTAGSLDARLSLDANVGALVRIEAGVRVRLVRIEVVVRGAQAAADLRIDLDAVAAVLLQALAAVRETPALVDGAREDRTEGAGLTPGGRGGYSASRRDRRSPNALGSGSWNRTCGSRRKPSTAPLSNTPSVSGTARYAPPAWYGSPSSR